MGRRPKPTTGQKKARPRRHNTNTTTCYKNLGKRRSLPSNPLWIGQCELVATLDQHRPKRIVCARFFRILGVMVHKCAHAEGILTKIRLDASSDFQWDHQYGHNRRRGWGGHLSLSVRGLSFRICPLYTGGCCGLSRESVLARL